MKTKLARRILPGLIVVLCLPSATMGTLGVVGLVADLAKAGSLPPLTILLYACSLIIGISRGQFLVGAAGALWIWLVVAGDRISTKLWTAGIILTAVYGLHIFNSEFRMH